MGGGYGRGRHSYTVYEGDELAIEAAKIDPKCMATSFAVAVQQNRDSANNQILWVGNEMASVIREEESVPIHTPTAWAWLAMARKALHEIAAGFVAYRNELTMMEEQAVNSLRQKEDFYEIYIPLKSLLLPCAPKYMDLSTGSTLSLMGARYKDGSQLLLVHLQRIGSKSDLLYSHSIDVLAAKMWGPGASQGGLLESTCKLDLKEPSYRMSQPHAYPSLLHKNHHYHHNCRSIHR